MRPLRDGDEFRIDLRHFDQHLYASVHMKGTQADVALFKADDKGRRLASIVRMTPESRAELHSTLGYLGVPLDKIHFFADDPRAPVHPHIPGGPKSPPPPGGMF